MSHPNIIAKVINATPQQVKCAIELLDSGNTVPFISRYRKEITGGLDDTQLRLLEQKLIYLRELDDRRETIITAIQEQGKLTAELKRAIIGADTKVRLEDLYLPYKKKRQTKAQIARLAGLEPLLQDLIRQPEVDPAVLAKSYINPNKDIKTTDAALDGARQIALEDIAEDADLIQQLRDWLWDNALIASTLIKAKEAQATKFKDYFEFSEKINKIPSHRMLAILRGRNTGLLTLKIDVTVAENSQHPAITKITQHLNWEVKKSAWLQRTIELSWVAKLHIRLSLQLTNQARATAETQAIKVFGRNMQDVLLAAPAGDKATLGLDPGFRTGIKVVAVDKTGKLTDTAVIYPHAPQKQWDKAKHIVKQLVLKHDIELISIGNGTASRETDQMVGEVLAELHKEKTKITTKKIMVSESGASIYSASPAAAKEFPDLDVTFRGSVSIARRLQDPLAELVKIEPKAIGVGQYQHDVNQVQLNKALSATVEDCVNSVGVDVNTASSALLQYVAGISASVAQEIINYRDKHGRFSNRQQLLQVSRLGEKMFTQCAGFLRIRNGEQPLDQSAVHPEAYPLVASIIKSLDCNISDVIGQSGKLSSINPGDFANHNYGMETVKDIIAELKKPGRDPRGEFKTATFDDNVHTITDIKPGMKLEGTVTNVTAFGAFVDIGVHQDGLIHISQLADVYVKDPSDIIKAGQIIRVTVLEVDIARKRISLSAKTGIKPEANTPKKSPVNKRASKSHAKQNRKPATNKGQTSNNPFGSLANAFKNAKKK
ncbi:Transcription accessory protein (S1 RNA-binding domain) [hydrothermal vent metagenome]|uniref:Transcription accessory protein (S1 RNA-binding domain) n=1 Tax=hydrothermal vent metagenome TaxID=652676 RepID=A0A3B0UZE9_9ZZZZ